MKELFAFNGCHCLFKCETTKAELPEIVKCMMIIGGIGAEGERMLVGRSAADLSTSGRTFHFRSSCII